MSQPSKDTDFSIFPVELAELGDVDLIECHRLFYDRYGTGEGCPSEIGEFANALLVEMRRRHLET